MLVQVWDVLIQYLHVHEMVTVDVGAVPRHQSYRSLFLT